MAERRIVLVDDEAHVRTFLNAILKAHQFQVSEAADGCEAMELMKTLEGAIDLLITDIKMPRMDGIMLAKAAANAYPQIPVLFISGWASDPLKSPAWKKPGYAFLQKPFLPKALIEAAERLLKDAKSARQAHSG